MDSEAIAIIAHSPLIANNTLRAFGWLGPWPLIIQKSKSQDSNI